MAQFTDSDHSNTSQDAKEQHSSYTAAGSGTASHGNRLAALKMKFACALDPACATLSI